MSEYLESFFVFSETAQKCATSINRNGVYIGRITSGTVEIGNVSKTYPVSRDLQQVIAQS